MVHVGYIVVAVSIGILVSLQPSINAVMARELSSSLLASTISITVSFCLIVLAWRLLGKGGGEISHIRHLPWWIVFGGVAGMVFVVGGVMVAPVLGFALFFVCIIGGQVLGAVNPVEQTDPEKEQERSQKIDGDVREGSPDSPLSARYLQ